VKVGDTVPAGQTVITGANSSVVLQFPDGQLASLTPNTRMTIEQYQYNEQAKSGNILLALLSGGMRAVTGLIGRNSPDKVAFKAGTATIGIRGTDVTIALAGGVVMAVSSSGTVTFTVPGNPPVVIPAGNGVSVSATATGTVTVTITNVAQLLSQIAQTNPALVGTVANALSPGTSATLSSASTSNTSAVGTTSTVQTGGDGETTIEFTPPPKSP